ncbi:Mavicyanin [Tripterygium wilfordii]|uniref:Mavicyanin n=1 Tax=Tripterygium wilfordii TaxID=458696 RepID=A0A7J7CEF0_TRIWF|nr:mavicyanin-like [Tripterygium wilfordii]KAF5732518.1 Mavicyanin [Tripterygium wilfordii]
MALFGDSLGSVYNVGDSTGWSSLGSFDYNGWAASMNMQVGDSIVFTYNPQLHNVMQVDKDDYVKCSTTHPKATFTTGNDGFIFNTPGTFFFICGFPGHCSSGLKMAIKVTNSAPQTNTSPPPPPPQQPKTPTLSPPPPSPSTFQGPPECPPGGAGGYQYPPGFTFYHPNAAAQLHPYKFTLLLLGLALLK